MSPLSQAQAGMMAVTMIDPDTIPLPSISALGGGLSTQDEFELDFSQVRLFKSYSIPPGELTSMASSLPTTTVRDSTESFKASHLSLQ